MPEDLQARLVAFAASLRTVGAVRSDTVERAFATVARHRCVPEFRYGPRTITVPQDEQPDGSVLDLVYSHRSLLTSTGQDGGPPSSSSAPTLMARMLETLDLLPGMRVLEIGAGTGYNAALISTMTDEPVVTVETGAAAFQGAADSVRRLGLGDRVTIVHGDGYRGEPSRGPYDRIVVTCGVAGLSPIWFDQLTADGVIVAPVAHGGVHPVLVATHHGGTVVATAALWADFMSATGPLRPSGLIHSDPADYIPPMPVTRTADVAPVSASHEYQDLWFYLATRDSRITRAYMEDDSVDTGRGACALRARRGAAWIHDDGSATAAGSPAVADELRVLVTDWIRDGRPALNDFVIEFDRTVTDEPLWVPHRWRSRDGIAPQVS